MKVLIGIILIACVISPVTIPVPDTSSLLYPAWMNDRVLLDFWEQTQCGDGFHLWILAPDPQPHKIYHTCVACGKVVEYLY